MFRRIPRYVVWLVFVVASLEAHADTVLIRDDLSSTTFSSGGATWTRSGDPSVSTVGNLRTWDWGVLASGGTNRQDWVTPTPPDIDTSKQLTWRQPGWKLNITPTEDTALEASLKVYDIVDGFDVLLASKTKIISGADFASNDPWNETLVVTTAGSIRKVSEEIKNVSGIITVNPQTFRARKELEMVVIEGLPNWQEPFLVTITAVPEPSSFLLLGSILAFVPFLRRTSKRNSSARCGFLKAVIARTRSVRSNPVE